MGCNDIFKLLPKDNSEFFDGVDMNLVEWLRQYAQKMNKLKHFTWFLRSHVI